MLEHERLSKRTLSLASWVIADQRRNGSRRCEEVAVSGSASEASNANGAVSTVVLILLPCLPSRVTCAATWRGCRLHASPSHRLLVDRFAASTQLPMHTRQAITRVITDVELANLCRQRRVTLRPLAHRTTTPVVVTAARHRQHTTLNRDRLGCSMIVNESVSHRCSFAKKTVAVFKISRSLRSRSTSARSL